MGTGKDPPKAAAILRDERMVVSSRERPDGAGAVSAKPTAPPISTHMGECGKCARFLSAAAGGRVFEAAVEADTCIHPRDGMANSHSHLRHAPRTRGRRERRKRFTVTRGGNRGRRA